MSTGRDYKKIQQIVLAYQKKLNELEEDRFLETPPIGGWSYSEVYFHIFDSSILSLKQLRAAITGEGEQKPTAFMVKLILFLGSLPPGRRYKAPKRLAERLKKISKAEATSLIDDFVQQLEKDTLLLPNANKNLKMPHPRFGYLNPFHWLSFIKIHLNHHLQQLHRIDQSYLR
ncbi:DinB family protein [Pedobacter sp. N36a]|uniref:DinB family protein n=1 Tax=Pedobacter sp. N36a TaxID=2767996 RepID=UPI0016572397|nr:DinB family protein [Pedobacter sp. N36a]MBC8986240.1 DinB family protein [Pedobacter sp. N36a]